MNFGKVAFFAIGAYTSTLLSIAGAPFVVGLLAGIFLSVLFGFLVALPALRLRADYLAIVTLSFGEILRLFFLNEQWLTNGRWVSVDPAAVILCFPGKLPFFYASFVICFLLSAIFFQKRSSIPYLEGRLKR